MTRELVPDVRVLTPSPTERHSVIAGGERGKVGELHRNAVRIAESIGIWAFQIEGQAVKLLAQPND